MQWHGRNLADIAPIGIWIADAQARIVDANVEASRMFGRTVEDLRGRPLTDLLPPENHARFRAEFPDMLRQDSLTREVCCVHADGTRLRVDLHVRILEDGHSVAYGTDVTARHRAQEQLRESEERFRAFMEHLPGPAFIKDAQGLYVFANRATLEQTGLQPEAMIGRTDVELWTGDTARALREHDRTVLEAGRPQAFDESCHDASGRLRHWQIVKFPLAAGDAAPLLAGVGVEITETMQLLDRVQMRQQALRLAATLGEIRLWTVRLSDGEATLSDDSTELRWLARQCASPGEEAAWLADGVHVDDRADLEAWRRRLFDDPQPGTFEYRCAPGRYGEVRWRSARIDVDYDADGRPSMIGGVLQDSTEQKRFEAETLRSRELLSRLVLDRSEALLTNERQLQAILDGIPGLVASFDAALHVRFANRAYRCRFGFEHREIVGQHLRDIVGQPLFDLLSPRIEAVLRGERQTYQRNIPDQDTPDVPQHFQMLLIPDVAEGEVRGLLDVAFDVTELKRAQIAAESANRAKSQFIANMSHEMRTPLNGVLGFAQLGLEEDDGRNPVARDFFARIAASGRLLLGVVNDVLDFAKLDAGQLAIDRLPANPRRVLDETLQPFEALARERALTLRLTCDDSLPERCVTDPQRLQQVLANLVSNAVKFTREGGIDVRARAEGATLVFAVRDSGIGIDPAIVSRLLRPFEQADEGIARRFGGAGLGLTIVSGVVALMGGTLAIESTPGVGSEFTVRLPLELPGATPEPARLA